MKETKVCHISTVHNVFDTRIFYKECSSLAKSGFETYFIATHDKEEVINGVKILPLKKQRYRIGRFIVSDLSAFIKALKLKAKIYHFHDPEFIPWAYLLKLFIKSRVIYDIHEDYYTQILIKKWIPPTFRKLIAMVFDKIEKFFSKRFNALIIAEEYYIERFRGINRRIVEILNYPIIPSSHTHIDLRIPRDNFNIIYSGTISEDRGIWNVVKGFHALVKKKDKAKLFLIGKFVNPALFEEVKEYIFKNGLKDKIIIVGGNEYVRREIIDSYYNYMDLGLTLILYNPHYYKTMPTKFFEYMKFGIPIIASDFPKWSDFFKRYRCGLTVNPEDPEEVSDKILYMMENDEERRKMGETGKKLVMEKFNWNKEKEKLISLYKELLG